MTCWRRSAPSAINYHAVRVIMTHFCVPSEERILLG